MIGETSGIGSTNAIGGNFFASNSSAKSLSESEKANNELLAYYTNMHGKGKEASGFLA